MKIKTLAYSILDNVPIVLESHKEKFIRVAPESGFNNPDAVTRIIEILY